MKLQEMPHNLCQWLAYTVVVIIGALVSWLIQWFVMRVVLDPKKLHEKLNKQNPSGAKDGSPLVGTRLQAPLGALEIILYASSVVFEHPEFIAVWFATKYVAGFNKWGEDTAGRTFYNRSLFGSGINILLGFFTGLTARWVIGHFANLN